MKTITQYFRKIHSYILYHAVQTNYPYKAFGIFGTITYPAYYLIWLYATPTGYENLYLRLVVVALCIPLILSNKWPEKLKDFLPIYWYVTMLYSLPFLFSFLLFKNNFSFASMLNGLSIITLSVLLLDLVPLIVILTLGSILGYLTFYLTSSIINLNTQVDLLLITYGSVLFFGALFAHRKDKAQKEKMKIMKSLSIAHELRTPLRSIESCASGIKTYLPALIETYKKSKDAGIDVIYIAPMHFEALAAATNIIRSEVLSSFSFIDILLANVNQEKIKSVSLQSLSMQASITDALERFPFDGDDKKLVAWDATLDFIYMGERSLMAHILFNLLKNALYHIKLSKKGRIHIYIEKTSQENILHFKDSGAGIDAKLLPYIFDAFFTTTTQGSGIGLSFCKMIVESFGGTIKCLSEKGEYTHFKLIFPAQISTQHKGDLS